MNILKNSTSGGSTSDLSAPATVGSLHSSPGFFLFFIKTIHLHFVPFITCYSREMWVRWATAGGKNKGTEGS
jgi:hypothetical protein